MTQEDLYYVIENINWYDISIQQNNVGKWILILVCKTDIESDMLAKAIYDSNGLKIHGFAKTDDDLYGLRIDFPGYNGHITCTTTRTLNNYYQLKQMESGEIIIEFITAGIHLRKLENGDDLFIYKRMTSLLDKINLN